MIVFSSKTGNNRRFVGKLDLPCIEITDDLVVSEPFVLLTYTTGMGQVPDPVKRFMERDGHKDLIVAVSSSGNRNWGKAYGRAANLIASQYNVPILSKFEMSGTQGDIEIFKERYDALWQNGSLLTMS